MEDESLLSSRRSRGGVGGRGAVEPVAAVAPLLVRPPRRRGRPRGAVPGPSFESVVRLWDAVAEGLSGDDDDDGPRVVWVETLEALKHAQRYFPVSADARRFVDENIVQIIHVCESPTTHRPQHHRTSTCRSERDVARQCLRRCFRILRDHPKAMEHRGAAHLAAYLGGKACTPRFPRMGSIRDLLRAVERIGIPPVPPADGGGRGGGGGDEPPREDATRAIVRAVTRHVAWLDDDALDGAVRGEDIGDVLGRLHSMHCRPTTAAAAPGRRRRRWLCPEYFAFWRGLALRSIRSRSLPTRLFGWDQLNLLIAVCEATCPPPRAYVVSGAGIGFVNGRYDFDPGPGGTAPEGGCAADRGTEPRYRLRGEGRLILRRRAARSSRRTTWTLGTDDVDCYRHDSATNGGRLPPLSGWVGGGLAGWGGGGRGGATTGPPPALRPVGVLAPPGEERDTLAHRLAGWAVEEGLVETALGPSSASVEVVEKSSRLFRFLARMCRRCDGPSDDDDDDDESGSAAHAAEAAAAAVPPPPDRCCLRASHLLLAWEACTTATDVRTVAAVQRTVQSSLPSLPARLRELAHPVVGAAIVRRIEARDPALRELRVGEEGEGGGTGTTPPPPPGSGSGPADPRGGACVYEPRGDAALATLGYAVGTNARVRVRFGDALSSEERSVVWTTALVSNIVGIWDVLSRF